MESRGAGNPRRRKADSHPAKAAEGDYRKSISVSACLSWISQFL